MQSYDDVANDVLRFDDVLEAVVDKSLESLDEMHVPLRLEDVIALKEFYIRLLADKLLPAEMRPRAKSPQSLTLR